MSKLFSFSYNSSSLPFGLASWQFQDNVCTRENKHQMPVMRDGLQGRFYLEELDCLGTVLLVNAGGGAAEGV